MEVDGMTQIAPVLTESTSAAGGGGDGVLSVQGVSKQFCRSLKRSPIAVTTLKPEILVVDEVLAVG